MVKKKHLDRITAVIARFIGSWWGVIFHTLWIICWIILDFNREFLSLWISLETIFIAIFILMASNKDEIERDKREALVQKRQMEVLNHDVVLDQRADRRQLEMIKILHHLEKEVKSIKKKLDKSLSSPKL